jgi:hypothetical protein
MKRRRRDDENVDDLSRTALPVGRMPAEDGELDGLSYLALVRLEREDPRFVVTVASEHKAHPRFGLSPERQAPDPLLVVTSPREREEPLFVASPNGAHVFDNAWDGAFLQLFGRVREQHARSPSCEDELTLLRQGSVNFKWLFICL